jgi:hypothetical protein
MSRPPVARLSRTSPPWPEGLPAVRRDTPAAARGRSRHRRSRSLEAAVVRRYLSELRPGAPGQRPPP